MFLPEVSVIIPTLNAARVLEDCLKSIFDQKYPQSKLEIILADGGSTDSTISIARRFGCIVVHNPKFTGEAGKAYGVRIAKGDIIAFIDSDNILPQKNWLHQMVSPFGDPDIKISEPIRYTWRSEGGSIERYCALIGMNDPLCLFIGNYDRENFLTLRWTDIPHHSQQFSGYLKIWLTGSPLPTIGANGTLFRSEILHTYDKSDYIFDIDIISDYITKHGKIIISKVDTGIIHTFSENSLTKFVRKQSRRISDFLYFNQLGLRKYQWSSNKSGVIKFILSCITVLPLLVQTYVGYSRKPDRAWFLHPVICWLTLFVYSSQYLLYISHVRKIHINRSSWKQ